MKVTISISKPGPLEWNDQGLSTPGPEQIDTLSLEQCNDSSEIAAAALEGFILDRLPLPIIQKKDSEIQRKAQRAINAEAQRGEANEHVEILKEHLREANALLLKSLKYFCQKNRQGQGPRGFVEDTGNWMNEVTQWL